MQMRRGDEGGVMRRGDVSMPNEHMKTRFDGAIKESEAPAADRETDGDTEHQTRWNNLQIQHLHIYIYIYNNIKENNGTAQRRGTEGKEAANFHGGEYEAAPYVPCQTDKSGRLRLETVDDLFNIMQLKKRRRERKAPINKKPQPVPETLPAWVDEKMFLTAASDNKMPLVEKYLTDGGNPNAADHFQRTALHKASFKGHVDLLLDQGAKVTYRDKERTESLSSPQLNSTPLHVAVRTGHCECAEHLIHCGADDGDTPMHDAVRINRFKMIKLLMMYGASLTTKNSDGKTPLETLNSWQNGAKSLLCNFSQEKPNSVTHS
ncbi:hypothetical protein F7725_023609 [Dissostichus mawsoni]|uniref:Ankyrin repeat domain-containing protein 1 n=1 Tax=Dissostichus mawsoni TaxID=36200 RepID=A0A7J5XZW7_DISMA|nr:hypothetical protein F7725_023609 [Dissostichus mawsoni]